MIWDTGKWNSVVPIGSGICSDCRGKSKDGDGNRCRACKGSGRCSWCDGTGTRKAKGTQRTHCRFCMNNDGVAEKVYYEKVGRHTSLDEVLAAISEEEQARAARKRCDAAIESFHLTQMTVPGLSEFEATGLQFMAWYCPRAGCQEHFYPDDPSGGADHLLCKIYGDPDIPLRMAKTGEAGGLSGIFNALHMHLRLLATKNHVKHIIDYFKTPERERLMEAYTRRYGEHLPGHLRGQRAVILAATSFEEIMLRHSSVVEPALRGEVER